MDGDDISGYQYSDSGLHDSHLCLLPTIVKILADLRWPPGPRRIFELGCGSGSIANKLSTQGYDVSGVDSSTQGIRQANLNYPLLKLEQASVYDNLVERYGQFPVVLSLEVVEHLYAPRKFAKAAFDLLLEGGTAVISTPYHGYWKNVALALTGKLDQHFTALWDNGHIKFWSVRTLSALMTEAGFRVENVYRVGRVPPLAKSMIFVASKKSR